MSTEHKLLEARYFLHQMGVLEANGDRTVFGYHLSAFLSAARSVLQYIRESSKSHGRQAWYDAEVASSQWFEFFKNMRDESIHEKPAAPKARHFVTISETLTVGDSLDVDKETNATPTQPSSPPMARSVGSGSSVESNTEYLVRIDGQEQRLLDCCASYMAELESTIQHARQEGIIP